MPKALNIVLPEEERGRTDAEIKRFDKLQRRLALPIITKDQREQTFVEIAQLERADKDRRAADSLDRHLVLLAALEHGRDPDTPPARDKLGRLRVLSRDGLESLLMQTRVTPAQYTAGMRYRELYEATERSIRSNLNRDISGSEDKRKLQDVGQKMQARKRLEAKVDAASRNGRGLMTLRLIAGQGRTLYALAPKSNANQALYRDALVIALDVVRQHFGIH